jgi:hypothetical protein
MAIFRTLFEAGYRMQNGGLSIQKSGFLMVKTSLDRFEYKENFSLYTNGLG